LLIDCHVLQLHPEPASLADLVVAAQLLLYLTLSAQLFLSDLFFEPPFLAGLFEIALSDQFLAGLFLSDQLFESIT